MRNSEGTGHNSDIDTLTPSTNVESNVPVIGGTGMEGVENFITLEKEIVEDVNKDTHELVSKFATRFDNFEGAELTEFKALSDDFKTKVENAGAQHTKNVEDVVKEKPTPPNGSYRMTPNEPVSIKEPQPEKLKVERKLPTPTGTWYEKLGVSENASLDEIKKAHGEMSRKYHVDRRQDEVLDENTSVSEEIKNNEHRAINSAEVEGKKYAEERMKAEAEARRAQQPKRPKPQPQTSTAQPTSAPKNESKSGAYSGKPGDWTSTRVNNPEPAKEDPVEVEMGDEEEVITEADPEEEFVRDERFTVEEQRQMNPDNRNLFKKLTSKARTFFVDKIWGAQEFVDKKINKTLSYSDRAQRSVISSYRKVGMLYRSAQIGAEKSKWIIQRDYYKALKKNQKPQEEAIVHLDNEIRNLEEQEKKGEKWAKVQKESLMIERGKLHMQFEKDKATIRSLEEKYSASSARISQFEDKRLGLVQEVVGRVERTIGPFEEKIGNLKNQEAILAQKIEAYKENIENQYKILNDIARKVEGNPFSRRGFRVQEKSAYQRLSQIQDLLDKVTTQDERIKRKIGRITERAQPWKDMRDQFAAQPTKTTFKPLDE